jgi:hypothetical protein
LALNQTKTFAFKKNHEGIGIALFKHDSFHSNSQQIAIEGCCHGELDTIYGHIATLEAKHDYKVDLLLICGDFQAIRNHQDLQCMAVPQKYRQLGGFHKYV